jgi:hypothetical protein
MRRLSPCDFQCYFQCDIEDGEKKLQGGRRRMRRLLPVKDIVFFFPAILTAHAPSLAL